MGVRFLTIRKFSEKSGYTEDAVRTKIQRGIWLEGDVWIKAPDGRQLIDVKGYETWVETGGELGRFQTAASKSPSRIAA
ncbi:MAG: excisionase [Cupriavidus sp.]|nr:excisionase [Cupriavidus sp.]